MMRFAFLSLVALLRAARCVYAESEADVIPNQYIVFYKKNADAAAANERLFFSPDSSVASSEDFRVVHELRKGITVAGITDEQYEVLLRDPSVEKVIPVSTSRHLMK